MRLRSRFPLAPVLILAVVLAWVLPRGSGASGFAPRGISPLHRKEALRSRFVTLAGRRAAPSARAVASACGSWATAFPDSAPLNLYTHAMVYDPVRDRLLVFGGVSLEPSAYNSTVWALPLSGTPAWTAVSTTGGGPTARIYPTAIYDPSRDRVVVHGGSDSGAENDTWALDLATSTWSAIATDDLPPPRAAGAAVYDPAGDRMIVFGGDGNDDVWALSFTGTPDWTQLTPSGTAPSAREMLTAILDAPHGRMILFGGEDGSGPENDVWALSLSGGGSWSQLSPSGTPPTARYAHAALFDAPRNRMIVFGGYDGGLAGDTNDLWSLALSGALKWTKLSPSGSLPPIADSHAIVYDSTRQRLVSFGGYAGAEQIWTTPLAATPAWTEVLPAGDRPMPRYGAVGAFDGARHRMLIYGGTPEGYVCDDLWAFTLGATPGWTRLQPTGTRPNRFDAAGVIDSTRSRLIVFGGTNLNSASVNETWAVSLSGTPAWSLLSPSGTKPAPRQGARAMYDPTRDRIVVYGGTDTTGTVRSDVWALSLSGSGAWSQLAPTGTAPAISDAAVAYDRANDRMIVVAGNESPAGAATWQLTFSGTPAWSTLATPNSPPGSVSPAAAYDAARRRLVLFGARNVACVLTRGTSDWVDPGIAGFAGDDGATAVFDLDDDQAVLFGGLPAQFNDPQDPNPIPTNEVRTLSLTAAWIEVLANPPLADAVSISPPGPCEPPGSTVTLTPTPPSGWQFSSWDGDASGSANPLSLTMSGDRIVIASFATAPPSCDGWRRVAPPPDSLPLDAPAAAFDPIRHRMIAVGQSTASGMFEAWSLPLAADTASWQRLTVSGSPPAAGVLLDARLVYDSRRDRMLIVAGSPSGGARNNIWELTLGATPAWNPVYTSISHGITLFLESAIYDPVRDRLVLFGGRDNPFRSVATYRNDAEAFPLNPITGWTTVHATGTPPAPRDGQVAIYDGIRDRMIVSGGFSPSGPITDSWALSLGDTVGGTSVWTPMDPSGVVPASSGFESAIWDSLRDRMVVFGGSAGDFTKPLPGESFHPAVADVHVLSLGAYPAWSQLSPDGLLPGPRQRQAAIYDPGHDRMIVTNGYGNAPNDSSAVPRHDTYALTFAGGDWLDLSVLPAGAGSIARTPDTDCIDDGTSVTLTATPTGAYQFVQWLGAPDPYTNPQTFTLDRSRAITAVFRDPAAATGGVTPLVTDLRLAPVPVRAALRVDYTLARAGRATLAVFDVTGREVARLADGAASIGRHSASWNLGNGRRVAPGVYLARLIAPDATRTQRFVVVR